MKYKRVGLIYPSNDSVSDFPQNVQNILSNWRFDQFLNIHVNNTNSLCCSYRLESINSFERRYNILDRDDIRILIIRINSRIFKGMRIRIINLDIRIFDRQLICHYPLEIRFPTTTFPAKLEILYLSALS